jgi:DNA-binding MarR family transcriptional regulator
MAADRKIRLRVLRGHDVPPEHRAREVILTLMRVVGRWNENSADLVKPHGLTLPHFEVLMCLNSAEGISQQDLSQQLMLTKGNICVMVQKMEASGLIHRRSDPADQRFHRLYLTDTGRRLIAKIIPGHRDLGNRILRGLSGGEQKTLYELLCRIDTAFDEIQT